MNRLAKSISILFLYDPVEERFFNQIVTHTNSLKESLNIHINIWHDRYIQAGQERQREFARYFNNADIILLLISAGFLADHAEEMEKALKQHRENKARVIPVLLRPSLWEGTSLEDLQILPSNRLAISQWHSADGAFYDISQGLKQTIISLLEAKKLAREESDLIEEDDAIAPITLFNSTSSISLFNYLTLPIKDSDSDIAHIFCLRTIMQILHQNYKALHGPTPEQEICEEVRRRVGIEYSPQECKRDLAFLIQHGSLVSSDDRSKTATSIAAFEALTHSKYYQATADAISIETFIESQIQVNSGTLSKNSLYEIKRYLEIIDAILAKSGPDQEDMEALAENWDEAFRMWQKWLALSLSYLSNLEINAQNEQYNLEKYMEYKRIVVSYVQRFARVLLDVAHSINELFSNWSQRKKTLLISYISQHKYENSPAISNKEPLSSVTDQISKQITELETWFRESAHSFHDRAVTEIQRVVNQAALLALYQRSHVNNATILRKLALQFMYISDIDTAQQVFDATFSNALPVHLPEKFTGNARIIEPSETHSVWDEPPTVRPWLLPIKRGRPGERRTEDPIEEDQQKIQELQAEQIQQERDRQRRFTRLFAQKLLNLGTLRSIEPQDRGILEEIIDTCLNDLVLHQHQDQTGAIVVLLNPDEQAYIRLCSHDGILSIPCYRLERQ